MLLLPFSVPPGLPRTSGGTDGTTACFVIFDIPSLGSPSYAHHPPRGLSVVSWRDLLHRFLVATNVRPVHRRPLFVANPRAPTPRPHPHRATLRYPNSGVKPGLGVLRSGLSLLYLDSRSYREPFTFFLGRHIKIHSESLEVECLCDTACPNRGFGLW